MIRDQIEERMGVILLQIAERQRAIRAARQAEEELQRLRADLVNLTRQYTEVQVDEAWNEIVRNRHL